MSIIRITLTSITMRKSHLELASAMQVGGQDPGHLSRDMTYPSGEVSARAVRRRELAEWSGRPSTSAVRAGLSDTLTVTTGTDSFFVETVNSPFDREAEDTIDKHPDKIAGMLVNCEAFAVGSGGSSTLAGESEDAFSARAGTSIAFTERSIHLGNSWSDRGVILSGSL